MDTLKPSQNSLKGGAMVQRDFLTENQVIQGVENYLKQKGRTSHKRVICKADAKKKEHGVDLAVKLENERKNGNWYFIEAKGNLKADGNKMKSSCSTNFRWILSQIILRIEVDPTRYNHNYGIAMPKSDIDKCKKLIQKNWALKHLKIRLYGAFFENEELTAIEYLPSDIYD